MPDVTVKVGQQVRLHPATDLFMKGVVYATVTKVGPKWVHIYHPRSGTKHKIPMCRIDQDLLWD